MEELILRVDNVKKMYRLGEIGGTTLRDELQRKKAKLLHKDDPTAKVGSKHHKKGEEFMALNGVSFEVKKGERVGIIGHNGAGKSTLLKLLSRVTAPTDGEICLNGRVASMLEVGTGFHGELTGRENIYMNGAILGMTKKEIAEKIDDIIDFSECRQFIDTPVKRYSSGMYVKLAFSVAAHLDSEIMIMDEVLAVGDMAFQKKCLDKMSDVSKKDGRTILYVSHNMSTIRQLCNRVIVLKKGKVIFDGDVEQGIQLYLGREIFDNLILEYGGTHKANQYIPITQIDVRKSQYIGKESTVFSQNEIMKIAIQWENLINIRDLCMRVEIMRPDRTPVGTSFSEAYYSGRQGDIGNALINMNLQNLVPGRYVTYYTFFCKGDNGTFYDVDCVEGLGFEIEEDSSNIRWSTESWGSIKLPGLIMEKR